MRSSTSLIPQTLEDAYRVLKRSDVGTLKFKSGSRRLEALGLLHAGLLAKLERQITPLEAYLMSVGPNQ